MRGTLLTLALTLTGDKGNSSPDFFTYNDEYDEENYSYPDGEEEVEMLEEETASFLPVFLSSPRVYTVSPGHTARLECQVDR